MAAWTQACVAHLERARVELARTDPTLARVRTKIEGGAVVVSVDAGGKIRAVHIAPTSPHTPARNNWSPPRDQWVDLPIIDKTYSTQKLNLFRYGKSLEAAITAYRGDDSPRAPPVPAWLQPFVDAFKPAAEACLREGE
jgi:hypothetical protein